MSLAPTSCRAACVARTPTRCVPSVTTTLPSPKHRSVAAADGMKFQITANNDWVPAIASGLFIGVKKGVLAFTTEHLRVVLAVAALALPVVNVLIQKQNYDWVSSSLAPSALAAETLNILPAVPAAVVAFGTKLCRDLATFVSVSGAFYGLLATLAAAVYLDKAVVWFCGGWALLYGAKFVTAVKDDSTVMIIPGIFSALLVAALVKFVDSQSMTMLTEVTVCIIAAQVAWSIFETARGFANEASS